MSEAGITSVRLPMNWAEIEPEARDRFAPRWEALDEQVEYAAENHMRAFMFVWGTPAWVSPARGEPVATARQRQAWLQFLHAAVCSLRPAGKLLARTPRPAAAAGSPVGDLERGEHRHLLQGTGPGTLRPPDPYLWPNCCTVRARLDGDPRRPLRPSPADPPEHSVRAASSPTSTGCRGSSGTSTASRCTPMLPMPARSGEIESLRRVMSFNGDAATPLYVTEMGWGSAVSSPAGSGGRVARRANSIAPSRC